MSLTLLVAASVAPTSAADQRVATPDNPIVYGSEGPEIWPDTNSWPEAEAKGLFRPVRTNTVSEVPPATGSGATAAANTATSATTTTTTPAVAPPPQAPPRVKVAKNEISASVDFLIGQGDVSLPIGFSLQTSPILAGNVDPLVVQPDRDSQYMGVSLSYSLGQAWYFDLNYANGESSGEVNLDEIVTGTVGQFDIKDDWYQAYVRYAFPGLRGKRLSAYVRGGVTFVQADMTLETTVPALGFYVQNDKTEDLTGNVGFGLLYSLYTTRHLRLGIQLEGEGFYGMRSQDSDENLPQSPGIQTSTATIDNDIYGAIGRATLRFEYRIGRSGLFKAFADGGVQGRYTNVDYDDLGSFGELLWGPYVKIGLRYAF